jgi:plasmid stabilization system protein ParE
MILFIRDMDLITDFIINNINAVAAYNFVDMVEKCVLKRLDNLSFFAPYPSKVFRKYPYYRIYFRNYTIYYVIIDGTMEVRRIIYTRSNVDGIIE